MTESVSPAPGAAQALSDDDLEELQDMLDDLRSRSAEVPVWEFCDGFLAALVCCPRAIDAAQYLPVLFDVDAAPQPAQGTEPALLAPFANAAQQARFMQLWQRRRDEVALQLASAVDALDDERAYQPEVVDMRGAIAGFDAQERAEMGVDDELPPPLGRIWAIGFMEAVAQWPGDWSSPRDKEAARQFTEALACIEALSEDDDDTSADLNLRGDDAPPSTSQARVQAFAEAIWAVYTLHACNRRGAPLRTGPKPGRNDPCHCGSGKKYKKCHGA